MQSVMTDRFRAASDVEMPRSSFDRSHGLKTTFDAGWLVPIYVDEALPGDTFHMKMTAFARLATPIHPVMDNMVMETFFFAVPNRLLWENWQRFCGERSFPGASIDFAVPQVTFNSAAVQPYSLTDYFGLPMFGANSLATVNALPYRAYNKIWNDWFRDQNLQNPLLEHVSDTAYAAISYNVMKRGKRHDYFTSALPWPQKGDEVLLPLGTTADILFEGGERDGTGALIRGLTGNSNMQFSGTPGENYSYGLLADLSTATAASINDIREAFQIQKLLERDARGGTRYTEIVKAHFGVNSPDQRLQRPEYLGGGRSPVNITPVAQTGPTGTATPQGNLAGFGTVAARDHGFTASFTEHCTLIGLVNVRADLTYQQGLDRMWSRSTRYDYYWPSLAHLGEQAVLNQEIYWSELAAVDEAAFGYQERYAEYRYKPSKITGAFRSSHPTSLDSWHLSQDFQALPVLGDTFIQDNPPVDRVIAVPDEPHFIMDAHFSLRTARPMPTYSVPGLVDHF